MRALKVLLISMTALVAVAPAAHAAGSATVDDVMRMPRNCVFFNPHSADLMPDGIGAVQQVVGKIVAAHATVVTVTGHANLIEARVDGVGNLAPAGTAQTLSAARAEAIRAALYANGLPTSVQILTVAAGADALPAPEILTPDVQKMLVHDDDGVLGSLGGEPLNRAACVAF